MLFAQNSRCRPDAGGWGESSDEMDKMRDASWKRTDEMEAWGVRWKLRDGKVMPARKARLHWLFAVCAGCVPVFRIPQMTDFLPSNDGGPVAVSSEDW